MEEKQKQENRDLTYRLFAGAIEAGDKIDFCSHLESGEESIKTGFQQIPVGNRGYFVLCRFCWGHVVTTVLDQYVSRGKRTIIHRNEKTDGGGGIKIKVGYE